MPRSESALAGADTSPTVAGDAVLYRAGADGTERRCAAWQGVRLHSAETVPALPLFPADIGYGGIRGARERSPYGAAMTERKTDPTNDVLNAQRQFWDQNFATRPEMFGDASSDPAQKALELLKLESKTSLLKLGGGQGRDTFFFARNGVSVTDARLFANCRGHGERQGTGIRVGRTRDSHSPRCPGSAPVR